MPDSPAEHHGEFPPPAGGAGGTPPAEQRLAATERGARLAIEERGPRLGTPYEPETAFAARLSQFFTASRHGASGSEPQQLRPMVANSGRENVRYLVWEFDCTREEMLAQVERWRSGEERARRVTVDDGPRLSATATAASLRGWAQSAERARPRAILDRRRHREGPSTRPPLPPRLPIRARV